RDRDERPKADHVGHVEGRRLHQPQAADETVFLLDVLVLVGHDPEDGSVSAIRAISPATNIALAGVKKSGRACPTPTRLIASGCRGRARSARSDRIARSTGFFPSFNFPS